jgi:hypothetical protein
MSRNILIVISAQSAVETLQAASQSLYKSGALFPGPYLSLQHSCMSRTVVTTQQQGHITAQM